MTSFQRTVLLTGTSLLLAILAPIEARANIIDVPFDYATIQAAIDAANNGDEIRVQPGVYNEAINLLGKSITLVSTDGSAATTITSTGSVITCTSGEGSSTVIDGFTITGGTGNPAPLAGGGGMFISASGPTVKDCVFSNNTAVFFGGAVWNGPGTDSTFSNCTFDGNEALPHPFLGTGSGGAIFNSGSVTIDGCMFSTNHATAGGGAVAVPGGTTTILRCTFFENSTDDNGGAILAGTSAPVEIHDCLFAGNQASVGGGAVVPQVSSVGVPFDMTNCVFTGNWSGSQGGAVLVAGASGTLTNCTLANNTTAGLGGAVALGVSPNPDLNLAGHADLTNSILYGNSDAIGMGEASQILMNTGTATISFCDIQGLNPQGPFAGNSNISLDPMYSDALGTDGMAGSTDDDLRLLAGSPCIDAGNSNAQLLPLDIDGAPRIAGAAVDMGAYEFAQSGALDTDGDGLTDDDELNLYGTDPNDPDTDGDGLLDGTEVDTAAGGACPNPLDSDSDQDTLSDGDEVAAGTNPCSADSDGDGLTDDIDPTPTEPGASSGYLEDVARGLGDQIDALPLAVFNGPNDNANNGRRNALRNHAASSANLIAEAAQAETDAEHNALIQDAIDELDSLLAKIDGQTPPPDWMDEGPDKTALRDEVLLLLSLLILEL